MNSRYSTATDLEDLNETMEQDREISLGTTTIVGIFFALALLCAVFFGFGYSMGRRSAQPTVAGTTQSTTETPSDDTEKPAPGSPISHPAASTVDESSAATPDLAPAKSQPTPATDHIKTVIATTTPEARPTPPAKATAARPAAPTPIAASTASPAVAVVQVAAVSHQEDADILATALKKRGYTVTVRQVPQDKLLHVQIGPFASKKDADAMRLRLQTDGYNAIVK